MTMIAVISYLNDESYLLDICLIYAAISFIAVIILSKVYTDLYLADKADEKKEKEGEEKK
jgi:multicomponent Na+:H+ antiporter subunit F